MDYLIMYLFGVVSGILGTFVWAVYESGKKKGRKDVQP